MQKKPQRINSLDDVKIICEKCEKIFKMYLKNKKVMLHYNSKDVSVECWYFNCSHCGAEHISICIDDKVESMRKEVLRRTKEISKSCDKLQRKAEIIEINKLKMEIKERMHLLKQLYEEQWGDKSESSRDRQEEAGTQNQ